MNSVILLNGIVTGNVTDNGTNVLEMEGCAIRNVNIKDVAKEAGVAVSTVSRVINNHSDVKKETKEHVLKVIKALNYVPNNSARNLKRISSNTIGIFVLGEYNPFFGDIVESLESEISARGYAVMVHFHHADRDAIESAAQFILEKKLLGIIYLGGVVSKDKERYLSRLEAPAVFTSTIVEDSVDKSLFSSVVIDEVNAVQEVVEYLIGLGHRKIGVITAEIEGLCASPERFIAFKSILKDNSIDFYDDYRVSGNYSIKSGFDAMNELLDRDNGLTAIFAVNDMMAIGAAKAVFARGLNVPNDISIVGFDGLDYGKYYNPSLTTIKQPNHGFAKESCNILLELIEGQGVTKHLVLDTEFLKRDSCKRII